MTYCGANPPPPPTTTPSQDPASQPRTLSMPPSEPPVKSRAHLSRLLEASGSSAPEVTSSTSRGGEERGRQPRHAPSPTVPHAPGHHLGQHLGCEERCKGLVCAIQGATKNTVVLDPMVVHRKQDTVHLEPNTNQITSHSAERQPRHAGCGCSKHGMCMRGWGPHGNGVCVTGAGRGGGKGRRLMGSPSAIRGLALGHKDE